MANARPLHIIFLDIWGIILRLAQDLAKKVLSDRSAGLLILSNCIVIILAIVQDWQVIELLWVYWMQNIIIGFFNWRRMINLKDFSTENFKSNGLQPPPTMEIKRSTALFFLLHYGFFHAVYLLYLLQFLSNIPSQVLLHGAIGIAIFFFNHYFSYRYNRELDDAGRPNIGNVMFLPYLRVVPMHLVVGFAVSISVGSIWSLLFFLLLKTAVDALMHVVEHAINRRQMAKVASGS